MAILVTEKWSGRRGRFDTNLRSWVSSRVYQVTGCTDEFVARAAVAGIGITLNCNHPLNGTLRCTSIDPQPAGFNFYEVTATWTVPPGGDATSSDYPLDQPLKISWEPGVWSEPSEIDAEGNPILNMAGDPVDPPPSLEKKTIVLCVRKWQPYYDPVQATTYLNAINSDDFSIAATPMAIEVPAGQAMCQSIRPEEEYTLASNFVVVVYRFAFRPNNTATSGVSQDAWDLRILNQGYNGWYSEPGSGTKKKGRLYFNGAEVGTPVPLDQTGLPIGPGFTVSRHEYPPIANPSPPVIGTNVDIESQTIGGVTLTYLHYMRGTFQPFGGLV